MGVHGTPGRPCPDIAAQEQSTTSPRPRGYAAVQPYSTILTPAIAAYLQVKAFDPGTGLSEGLVLPAILFVGFTGVWVPPGHPRYVPVWTFAGGVLAAAVAGAIAGLPPAHALGVALGSTLAAVAMAAIYRRGLADVTSWTPRTPQDVLWLLAAGISASLFAALIGAAPYRLPLPLPLVTGRSAADLAPFVITASPVSLGSLTARLFVWTGLGAVTVLMYWWTGLERVLPRRSLVLRLVPLVTAPPALALVYVDQAHPWLFLPLLASFLAGLIYTPYAATAYTVGVSLVAATLGMTIGGYNYLDPTLPNGAMLDIVLAVAGYQTLVVVLYRDQYARLNLQLQRNEAMARGQARLLETVFESMSDGIALIDENYHVTLHNRALRTLLRRPFPAAAPPSYAQYFGMRLSSTGEPIADDLELASHITSAAPEILVGEPGDERRLSVTTTPIIENSGTAVMLMRDITADHDRLEALRAFAGHVAHDLRSPLTSVVSWIEVAQEELEGGDANSATDTVRRAAQAAMRMDGVIADWLAYTVARKGIMQPAPVPLAELVEDVCELASGADGLRYTVSTPHTVYADPALTRQLFANLIGNAVKYRRPGHAPRLTVTSRPDADPDLVEISVADCGIGIPAGEEETIFGEFARSERDEAHHVGTGLGLALCRSIVERHGGTIRAATNADGGATLTFTLPRAAA